MNRIAQNDLLARMYRHLQRSGMPGEQADGFTMGLQMALHHPEWAIAVARAIDEGTSYQMPDVLATMQALARDVPVPPAAAPAPEGRTLDLVVEEAVAFLSGGVITFEEQITLRDGLRAALDRAGSPQGGR